jgi:hypothetical protein
METFECKTDFRSMLKLSLLCFGVTGLLLGGYTLGSGYLSVSGYGDWSVTGHELVGWLSLLGMAIMAVSVVGFFVSRIRCASVAVLIGSTVMVTLCLVSLKSAETIRARGFERLAREAAPLVAAIETFASEYGHPPASLEQVRVTFPEGTVIKGGELPDFEYITGDFARERHHGNPWVLVLETPSGPLRWDSFVYYPLQNYPPLAAGGWYERVGDWAYLHE